jgi:hypothetical protein
MRPLLTPFVRGTCGDVLVTQHWGEYLLDLKEHQPIHLNSVPPPQDLPLTEPDGLAVRPWLCILDVIGSYFGRNTEYPEIFHKFFRCLRTIIGKIRRLGHDHFL